MDCFLAEFEQNLLLALLWRTEGQGTVKTLLEWGWSLACWTCVQSVDCSGTGPVTELAGCHWSPLLQTIPTCVSQRRGWWSSPPPTLAPTALPNLSPPGRLVTDLDVWKWICGFGSRTANRSARVSSKDAPLTPAHRRAGGEGEGMEVRGVPRVSTLWLLQRDRHCRSVTMATLFDSYNNGSSSPHPLFLSCTCSSTFTEIALLHRLNSEAQVI